MVQHADIDHTGITGVGETGTAAHIADASDAHDASAISVLDTATNFTGTDVEAVLAELQDNIDAIGGGGVASGTSFPGSPSTDDLFYRTDRDLLYFYSGSAWLTVTMYESQFVWSVAGVAADAAQAYYPVDSTYGMFLVEFIASWHVGGTNNGSNFWEIELRRVDSAAAETEIGNVSTSAGSGSTWTRGTLSIGAALDSSARVLLVRADETGAAGNLSFACALRFRLIG